MAIDCVGFPFQHALHVEAMLAMLPLVAAFLHMTFLPYTPLIATLCISYPCCASCPGPLTSPAPYPLPTSLSTPPCGTTWLQPLLLQLMELLHASAAAALLLEDSFWHPSHELILWASCSCAKSCALVLIRTKSNEILGWIPAWIFLVSHILTTSCCL